MSDECSFGWAAGCAICRWSLLAEDVCSESGKQSKWRPEQIGGLHVRVASFVLLSCNGRWWRVDIDSGKAVREEDDGGILVAENNSGGQWSDTKNPNFSSFVYQRLIPSLAVISDNDYNDLPITNPCLHSDEGSVPLLFFSQRPVTLR